MHSNYSATVEQHVIVYYDRILHMFISSSEAMITARGIALVLKTGLGDYALKDNNIHQWHFEDGI